ncbi:hypothetical protein V8E55_007414 [Tylopilus felleus]
MLKVAFVISLCLSSVSASILYPLPHESQQVFQGNDVEVTEAAINRLLVARMMMILSRSCVFGAEPVWMTEGDKLRLKKQGLSFMDLTERKRYFGRQAERQKQTEWPELRYCDRHKVHEIVQILKVEEMEYNLGNLASFFNRSEYGVQSSRVIARFEPVRGRSPNNHAIKVPRIIIGAHQDSANYAFPLLPAPGADDDGSGTVTILEAFRALDQAGFKPELPVEFHWYAAEDWAAKT